MSRDLPSRPEGPGDRAGVSRHAQGLPPLYARWMEDALPGPLPVETRATCSTCPLCPREDRAHPVAGLFHPDTKCCTYIPTLPNFIVGAILADEDPAAQDGRHTVRVRLEQGEGVTPLGLRTPAAHAILYRAGGEPVFGRSPALRCPHYVAEGGTCGIWRHREAVCATWFCRHVRGKTGLAFWSALQRLLRVAERALTIHAAASLGVDPELLARFAADGDAGPKLGPENLGGQPLPNRSDEWRSWPDGKEAFYIACAEMVATLGWDDVVALGGAPLQVAARAAVACRQRLDEDRPPAKVRPGPTRVLERNQDFVYLVAYRPYDPLRLPRVLFDHLDLLEDVPLSDGLERLHQTVGGELSDESLALLVDHGVLEPDER